MITAELGKYAERFVAFRQMMAAVPPTSRLAVFENAVAEIAKYIGNGLDRVVAADELVEMAMLGGLDDADAVQWIISRGFEKIKPNGKTHGAYTDYGADARGPASVVIEPTSYILPDPSTIPQRAWLYGTHYMRGVVTATVAPGGFGKTTLALYEALTMMNLGYRVWYISGEDDKTEIDRRIAAHCQKHNPKPFDGRVFVDDKISFPFKIAKSGRNGPEFDNDRLVAFEQAVIRHKIDVVILDPFVSFHFLAENDTAAMDAFVKRLGEICVRCNCGIELSHHVRKPGFGQVEITVYDARGAAAIVNAVRSCRVLNQMSQNEAQQIKKTSEERPFYIRIDSGKRNMAPAEKARWMHLVSIEIANGDHVQAIDDTFEFKPEATTEDDEDWVRLTMKNGTQYRTDSRSDDWFGLEVARHFNREVDAAGCKWINQQIKKWLAPAKHRKNKPLLRKVTRDDEHRKPRGFFELVEEAEDTNARKVADGEVID